MSSTKTIVRAFVLFAFSVGLSGCLSNTLDQPCQTNDDCSASWGEFCKVPQGCDPTQQIATCQVRPTQGQCSDSPEFTVCGCDQRNYRSACWAAQASQSFVHYGACTSESLIDLE